jgi:hypothetical protein
MGVHMGVVAAVGASAAEQKGCKTDIYIQSFCCRFVKITLGTMSKKTRVIFRNCHPMWEQK